jgi:hypothetical protein
MSEDRIHRAALAECAAVFNAQFERLRDDEAALDLVEQKIRAESIKGKCGPTKDQVRKAAGLRRLIGIRRQVMQVMQDYADEISQAMERPGDVDE